MLLQKVKEVYALEMLEFEVLLNLNLAQGKYTLYILRDTLVIIFISVCSSSESSLSMRVDPWNLGTMETLGECKSS